MVRDQYQSHSLHGRMKFVNVEVWNVVMLGIFVVLEIVFGCLE